MGSEVQLDRAGCFSISPRAPRKPEAQYDLIILDPPSFTKTKGGLHDALRGYRELHVRAFKLLSRDGMLATFSCSHHVNEAVFRANDRRCPGRCASLRAPAAPLRAGTRSSGAADVARDGIFQGHAPGNDARPIARAGITSGNFLPFHLVSAGKLWNYNARSLISLHGSSTDYFRPRPLKKISWQNEFDQLNRCWS